MDKITKVIGAIIIIVIIGVVILSLTRKANEDTFTLTYELNEELREGGTANYIDISARLKNNSIGTFKTSFTQEKIIISHRIIGEDDFAYLPLAVDAIIIPFGSIKRSANLNVSTNVDHELIITSIFTIGEKEFHLQERIILKNGMLPQA